MYPTVRYERNIRCYGLIIWLNRDLRGVSEVGGKLLRVSKNGTIVSNYGLECGIMVWLLIEW